MSRPRKLKHWEKRARSRISSTLLDGFEDIAKDAQLGEELVSAVLALVRLGASSYSRDRWDFLSIAKFIWNL
jgi:hypothetical protein